MGGAVWAVLERVGAQGIQFLSMLFLARLLSPEEFALIAMLTIFFALANTLVDSGFSQALIREDEISEEDKSTTFFINFITSLLMFGALWLSAPFIADFYEKPELIGLTRFMAFAPILFSFSIIQRAILSHQIDFKTQMLANIGAAFLAGAIAIILAFYDFGVWALAVQYVCMALFTSIFFWVMNPWIPKSFIDKESFRKLFGFGSNILLSGLLESIFVHLYKLIIGKYFPAAMLGYYTQADNFKNVASQNLASSFTKVTYPALSKVKNDKERVHSAFRQILLVTSYFIFPFMIGMMLVADPMIVVLIGEKWAPVVPILQVLCLSGMIHHLHNANQNVLKVFGRSDLFLNLQVLKKVGVVIAIIVGLWYGFWGLIIGIVVSAYVGLIINMHYAKKVFGYTGLQQVKDLFPVLLLNAPMIITVTLVHRFIHLSPVLDLIIMVVTGALSYVGISLILKPESMKQVVYLLRPKFPILNHLKV